MASPWNFFTRLVSPRRDKKHDDGSTINVSSDGPALLPQIEAPAESSLNSADRPADEEPVQPEEIVTGDQNADAGERAQPRAAVDISASEDRENVVTGAADGAKLQQAAASGPRNQRGRGKKAGKVEVASEASENVPTVSDEATRLDDEIRDLRMQLKGKLQLQNAQLKKMLERFER